LAEYHAAVKAFDAAANVLVDRLNRGVVPSTDEIQAEQSARDWVLIARRNAWNALGP